MPPKAKKTIPLTGIERLALLIRLGRTEDEATSMNERQQTDWIRKTLTERAKKLNPPWDKPWNRSGIAELLDFLQEQGIGIEEEKESKHPTH